MSENRLREHEVRRFAWILSILAGLFAFRVTAQLIQVWHPVAYLPSFETWQSGAFPYPLLLSSQVAIAMLCLRIVWRMFRGAVLPVKKKGTIFLYLGGLYLAVMGIRLVVGLTVAPNHFWFGAKLPTVFHFVLAAFLLAYGRFHVSVANPSCPVHQEATV